MKHTFTPIKWILLAVLMATVVAMSGCTGDPDETDSAMESTEDSVSETVTESESETTTVADIHVSLSLVDQQDRVIADAVLRFVSADPTFEAKIVKTDGNGTGSVILPEGTYTVYFDELPAYHLGGAPTLEVKAGMEPVVFDIVNNTPDGSEAHPFFISENTTTVPFGADTTYHFTMFGGDRRSLVIENADVTVTVDGVVHAPDENGRIAVPLVVANQQNHISYAVTSAKDQDVIITIVSEAGAMENPIVAVAGAPIVCDVPKDTIMYYTFTATKTGTLVLTTADIINNISMTNRNTSQTTNFTNGSVDPLLMEINEGDVVILTVSTVGGDATLPTQTVTFTLTEEVQ